MVGPLLSIIVHIYINKILGAFKMTDKDAIKKLKEKNYLLELENEKLKIIIVRQEKVIKNIKIILN